MAKSVRFKVSIPEPRSHMVRVEMTVRGIDDAAHVDLALPVWTPGSYLVREYSQFVRVLRATDRDGDRREVTKLDKARWRVDCTVVKEVTVVYEVYGHTLNVRYNHVEEDHAFLHGPALFLYPVDRLSDGVELHVHLPDGWQIWTGLHRPDTHNYFEADNFDQLFDCPLLCGALEVIEFQAAETPHRYVLWGRGNYDREQLAADTKRIVEASSRIFGGQVPYDDFSFLTLLTDDQYGGLEHRNTTALMYPRRAFADRKSDKSPDDKYLDFLGLVSHEHFHVWNVKRIRPERLGPFDYQNENYTRDLWTVEGITSYYQNVSLLRAGVIDGAKFLELFGKQLAALHSIPGRNVTSLQSASFDTWIKLYRPHPHNLNSNISYYLKGALAALVLDVMIRVDTGGEKSLDDVMRHLWMHYAGETGYPEGGYAAIVQEVVGHDVEEFFDVFIRGTEDPDWNDWFENIGLQVVTKVEPGTPPFIGFTEKDCTVKAVAAGSPAERAGLQPDDELVAIDGFKSSGRVEALLLETEPGVPVSFHVFRRGELIELAVTPEEPRPSKWSFERRADAQDAALALLESWLGTTDISQADEEE